MGEGTQVPSMPFTVGQFVRMTTTTDYNNFTNGSLDQKVLYMDWNKIGFKDLNGGSGTVFDANCPIGEVLRQVDSNGEFVCVVASSGNVDTNWQTSWNTFDANMKASYLTPVDGNSWYQPKGSYATQDTNRQTAGFANAQDAQLQDLNINKHNIVDANNIYGKVFYNDSNKDYGIIYCTDGNVVTGYIKNYTC